MVGSLECGAHHSGRIYTPAQPQTYVIGAPPTLTPSQAAAQRSLANAPLLTDAQCADALATFESVNASEYADPIAMLNAFSATSPACAAYVQRQLAAIRTGTFAQTSGTTGTGGSGSAPLQVYQNSDDSCRAMWDVIRTSTTFGSQNDVIAAVHTFAASHPQCSDWLARTFFDASGNPSTAPAPAAQSASAGGGSMLLLGALALAALASLGGGKMRL